jgi:hypothetical protein
MDKRNMRKTEQINTSLVIFYFYFEISVIFYLFEIQNLIYLSKMSYGNSQDAPALTNGLRKCGIYTQRNFMQP